MTDVTIMSTRELILTAFGLVFMVSVFPVCRSEENSTSLQSDNPESSKKDNSDSLFGKLSTYHVLAIGAGVGVGLCFLVCCIVGLLVYCRRQGREEGRKEEQRRTSNNNRQDGAAYTEINTEQETSFSAASNPNYMDRPDNIISGIKSSADKPDSGKTAVYQLLKKPNENMGTAEYMDPEKYTQPPVFHLKRDEDEDEDEEDEDVYIQHSAPNGKSRHNYIELRKPGCICRDSVLPKPETSLSTKPSQSTDRTRLDLEKSSCQISSKSKQQKPTPGKYENVQNVPSRPGLPKSSDYVDVDDPRLSKPADYVDVDNRSHSKSADYVDVDDPSLSKLADNPTVSKSANKVAAENQSRSKSADYVDVDDPSLSKPSNISSRDDRIIKSSQHANQKRLDFQSSSKINKPKQTPGKYENVQNVPRSGLPNSSDYVDVDDPSLSKSADDPTVSKSADKVAAEKQSYSKSNHQKPMTGRYENVQNAHNRSGLPKSSDYVDVDDPSILKSADHVAAGYPNLSKSDDYVDVDVLVFQNLLIYEDDLMLLILNTFTACGHILVLKWKFSHYIYFHAFRISSCYRENNNVRIYSFCV
ncbi:uncharacterized protein [Amphiura filiformis]|uniref:uncharacterized protein n=1 Tax=Amphiura filiformis TaxID=82378 RepID=UPI003B2111A3